MLYASGGGIRIFNAIRAATRRGGDVGNSTSVGGRREESLLYAAGAGLACRRPKRLKKGVKLSEKRRCAARRWRRQQRKRRRTAVELVALRVGGGVSLPAAKFWGEKASKLLKLLRRRDEKERWKERGKSSQREFLRGKVEGRWWWGERWVGLVVNITMSEPVALKKTRMAARAEFLNTQAAIQPKARDRKHGLLFEKHQSSLVNQTAEIEWSPEKPRKIRWFSVDLRSRRVARAKFRTLAFTTTIDDCARGAAMPSQLRIYGTSSEWIPATSEKVLERSELLGAELRPEDFSNSQRCLYAPIDDSPLFLLSAFLDGSPPPPQRYDTECHIISHADFLRRSAFPTEWLGAPQFPRRSVDPDGCSGDLPFFNFFNSTCLRFNTAFGFIRPSPFFDFFLNSDVVCSILRSTMPLSIRVHGHTKFFLHHFNLFNEVIPKPAFTFHWVSIQPDLHGMHILTVCASFHMKTLTWIDFGAVSGIPGLTSILNVGLILVEFGLISYRPHKYCSFDIEL
ncbi:hypothetical protein R3P38DRAFT_3348624 [Favolaschia claudopus]|uniref:Uncharacterized protein n=1 Tax=Favolaschia claudopus TaxID=2862362 RepID=A0AAW0CS54_9AGAR